MTKHDQNPGAEEAQPQSQGLMDKLPDKGGGPHPYRGARPNFENDEKALPTRLGEAKNVTPVRHDVEDGLTNFTVTEVLSDLIKNTEAAGLRPGAVTCKGQWSPCKTIDLRHEYTFRRFGMGDAWRRAAPSRSSPVDKAGNEQRNLQNKPS